MNVTKCTLHGGPADNDFLNLLDDRDYVWVSPRQPLKIAELDPPKNVLYGYKRVSGTTFVFDTEIHFDGENWTWPTTN